MERRAECRFDANAVAAVTPLEPPRPALAARIVNVSRNGAALRLEDPLATGALLKIECNDSLLLGVVAYCRPEGDAYIAGIQVEHAVFGLAGLAALARQLAADEPGLSPPAGLSEATGAAGRRREPC